MLVGDSIALTTKRTRQQTAPSRERGPFTNVIPDVYSVAGDVLTLKRKLSVVRPDGTLADIPNSRQTIVYRKNSQARLEPAPPRQFVQPR